MEKMQCQSPMSHLAHNSAHSALVRWSVGQHKSKKQHFCPRHPSATDISRVSGLVYLKGPLSRDPRLPTAMQGTKGQRKLNETIHSSKFQ